MSNQVTILLAIKDRKEFTKQFLDFNNKYNKNSKIFLADGSKKKIDIHSINKIHS